MDGCISCLPRVGAAVAKYAAPFLNCGSRSRPRCSYLIDLLPESKRQLSPQFPQRLSPACPGRRNRRWWTEPPTTSNRQAEGRPKLGWFSSRPPGRRRGRSRTRIRPPHHRGASCRAGARRSGAFHVVVSKTVPFSAKMSNGTGQGFCGQGESWCGEGTGGRSATGAQSLGTAELFGCRTDGVSTNRLLVDNGGRADGLHGSLLLGSLGSGHFA